MLRAGAEVCLEESHTADLLLAAAAAAAPPAVLVPVLLAAAAAAAAAAAWVSYQRSALCRHPAFSASLQVACLALLLLLPLLLLLHHLLVQRLHLQGLRASLQLQVLLLQLLVTVLLPGTRPAAAPAAAAAALLVLHRFASHRLPPALLRVPQHKAKLVQGCLLLQHRPARRLLLLLLLLQAAGTLASLCTLVPLQSSS
jgi:hypothetical protein